MWNIQPSAAKPGSPTFPLAKCSTWNILQTTSPTAVYLEDADGLSHGPERDCVADHPSGRVPFGVPCLRGPARAARPNRQKAELRTGSWKVSAGLVLGTRCGWCSAHSRAPPPTSDARGTQSRISSILTPPPQTRIEMSLRLSALAPIIYRQASAGCSAQASLAQW